MQDCDVHATREELAMNLEELAILHATVVLHAGKNRPPPGFPLIYRGGATHDLVKPNGVGYY